jgi:hypothetical protein
VPSQYTIGEKGRKSRWLSAVHASGCEGHESWKTFIKAHLGAIAGMDFCMVEVVTLLGLIRYHVLFVIDIGRRTGGRSDSEGA